MTEAQYGRLLDTIEFGQADKLNTVQVRDDVLAYLAEKAYNQVTSRQHEGTAFNADMFIEFDMFGFDDVIAAGIVSNNDAEQLYATIRSLEA